jgi:hypothetical protein
MKTRAGKRRDLVKEQLWRRTIADQARCGLSIQAYCQREGLEPRNFHWWRQALARYEREVPSDRIFAPTNSTTNRPAPSAFLPVRVVQAASTSLLSKSRPELYWM